MRRTDYGYDAPYALVIFACVAIASGVAAVVAWWNGSHSIAVPMAGYCLFFAGNAASFFYTTRRGKFIEWERILDGLSLGGGEQVLDMGCGRGAVLMAVARRLTTGR